MTKVKLLLLQALMLMSLAASAQLERNQERVGSDGTTYSERDRARTAENTAKPNAPLKSPVTSPTINFQEQMEAQRKARDAARERNTADAKARNAMLQAEEQRRKDIIKELDADVTKNGEVYKKQLYAAGFDGSSWQSRGWIQSLVWDRDKPQKVKTDFLTDISVDKRNFETNKNTAPPRQLLASIAGYTPAWEDAFKDLDWMEEKYPAYISSIDTLRFIALAYYNGMVAPNGERYSGDELNDGSLYKQVEYVTKIFKPLAEKYPELALQVAGMGTPTNTGIDRNPFWKLTALANANPTEAMKYARLALHTISPSNSADMKPLPLRLSGETEYFFSSISVTEWKEILIAHNKDFGEFVENSLQHGGFDMFLQGQQEYSFRLKNHKMEILSRKKYSDWHLELVVNAMADDGDLDAQSLLGVYAIQGAPHRDVEQGIKLLQKAAKNGSITAHFNLYLATALPIKFGGDDQRKIEEASLVTFIENSNKEQLNQAVRLFNALIHNKSYDHFYAKYLTSPIQDALVARGKTLGMNLKKD